MFSLRTQNLYMSHSLNVADEKEDKLFIKKKHTLCSNVASLNIYFSYLISSPIVQSNVFKAWFSEYATVGSIHGSCSIILHKAITKPYKDFTECMNILLQPSKLLFLSIISIILSKISVV